MDKQVLIHLLGKDRLNAFVVKFADSFIFETAFTAIDCPEATYEWRVYSLDQMLDGFNQSNSVVSLQSKWKLEKRSLSPGMYLVKVFITFNWGIKYDFGFLEVVPSGIVARIDGGQNIMRGQDSLLTLNASVSINKDVEPGNYKGMNFSWHCKEEHENIGNMTELQVIQEGAGNRSGCFGTGIGRLDSTERVLKVDPRKMSTGVTYTFRVEVVNEKFSDSYEQNIRLVTGPVPHVSVR